MQCLWRGRSTAPLWLTQWMRAYGSYGSCVVLTLATSYGQLAAITALRIAVLRQKQHFVKSTFSGSTVFLLVGSSSEGSVFKWDAAVCS